MSQFSLPSRRVIGRILGTIAAVGALLTASIVGGAPAAQAATYPGGITSVTTQHTQLDWGQRFKLDFTWAVPNGAKGGDIFSLRLPAELAPAATTSFDLTDEGGNVVANAVWNGTEVVFTLDNFLNGKTKIGGKGYFFVDWVKLPDSADGGNIDLNFGVGIPPLTIEVGPEPGPWIPGPAPVEQDAWKYGWFTDKSEGHLQWGIGLPTRAQGYAGPIVITDVMGVGQKLDQASFEVKAQRFTGPTEDISVTEDVADARWDVTAASDGGFTLTLDTIGAAETRDGVAYSAEFITIYYVVETTAGTPEFTNVVTIKSPSEQLETGELGRVARAGSGGDGDATDPVPAISLKKWSVADGSIDAGDYNTEPKTVEPGAKEALKLTVTNVGDEVLSNVVVADNTLRGPAAINLSCDFSPLGGPSTGTNWDGPFVPGASFECVLELPGMSAGVAHANTATVSAVGAFSGIPVAAEDPWNAVTEPSEPTPVGKPPVDNPTEPVGSSAQGNAGLAVTGVATDGMLALAALLVAGGTAVLLRLNRRRAS
ncbi:Ig-like domain-containing protein [Lysinibacter cavernae]|uniref:SDR-like Ig domain-containing protein n=1 Tax=Lysinibacter cavernae TaxID=1640652 RepID=A0A7X5QY65_9MICO|nr:Ig-like domain-containing protein [Lysinibacter cavernae]NIH52155.1 hypothetical protein [Lysinibacter cavernae]